MSLKHIEIDAKQNTHLVDKLTVLNEYARHVWMYKHTPRYSHYLISLQYS